MQRDIFALLKDDSGLTGEVNHLLAEDFTWPGSGKFFNYQLKEFPELMDAVAQTIGQVPPASLKRAVARFPDRVKPAISYLQYQQQRCSIPNPLGYLYRAITDGWELMVPQAISPVGFCEWFEAAKTSVSVVGRQSDRRGASEGYL